MPSPRQIQVAQGLSPPGGEAAAAPGMAKGVQDPVQGTGGCTGSAYAASQHHQPNGGSGCVAQASLAPRARRRHPPPRQRSHGTTAGIQISHQPSLGLVRHEEIWGVPPR
eukprot:7347639-Pyramimonas_sp.AAC.1